MRIAFCGASGTGKTTLARVIGQELGLSMNPHGSRSTAKKMGFSNPYDVDRASLKWYQALLKEGHTPELAAIEAIDDYNSHGGETCRSLFQRELQRTKIDWEREQTREDRGFIVDRTTIDDFCYASMHSPDALDTSFLNNAKNHMAVYDMVFYTPVSSFINIDGDGARVGEIAYHRAFDMFVYGVLDRWYPDFEAVRQVSLTKRVQFVMDRVDSHPLE